MLAMPVLMPAMPVLARAAAEPTPSQSARWDYATRTLDNGLKVIVLEDFSTPVVAVQVWYHVGSKNENPERQGFAHMFEHMMFRGTDRLGPKDHFDLIRKVGGDCNAYTSFDQTVYVQKLPSNQLDLALYLEAERMAFLKIDQLSFDTERSVVEEERRQGLNQPYGTVFERALPQVFTQHPYRWTPIGRIPHLRRASIEELSRFWETYYVPNNAALVIVGAVKKEEALDRAEQYFGWIPRGDPAPKVTVVEPEQKEARLIKLTEARGPVTIVAQGFRGVPMAHPDAMALEVALTVLGDGESSRLYQKLVKDMKVAVIAAAGMQSLEQDSIMGAGAALPPGGGGKQAEVLAVIDAEIEKLKTEGASDAEVEKAKLNILKGQVTQAQEVENRARLLGTYGVLMGDLDRVNRRFDEIRAVSAADVKRVMNTYFTPERRNTVIVEPGGMGEMLKAAAGGASTEETEVPKPKPPENNIVAERMGPKTTAVRPANFPTTAPIAPVLDTFPSPTIAEKTLGNGLKVVVVPRNQIPLVTMTLGLRAGAVTEAPNAVGHAAMAAQLLTQGTSNYESKALATKLEENAISLGGGVDMDSGTVNASALTERADLAMQLLAEVVLRPTFPASEFEQARDQAISGLAISEQNAGYLANRELRKRLFGSHPYSRSASGELADVKALTRDGLAAWWKTYVRPDTTALYIAGDITPDAAFALAEKYFGEFKAEGDKPAIPVAEIPQHGQTTIYLVDKPGAVQSEIRMGKSGIDRTDARWPAARVLTQVFGGSFSSRLNDVVRVQKGLTYGISGYFRPMKTGGTFEISTFSKTESTAATVEATLAEIVRMRETPADAKELATAKSFLVGSFAGDRETAQDVVRDLWMLDYTGLPKDYLKSMLEGVARTEESNVTLLAKEKMDEKRLAIVVVGDAKKIRAELEKIAPVVLVNPKDPPTTQPK
jgi:zinc protease